ncbi:twin-arginine translocation pathway signal protein [Endozoicomonas sp. SM1973]|uniref:Twin-arginine translocation pathway signal protein n=1 Tax=Spartinivicinus marinus TaxID=2994442 RepID=A0A853I3K1_9GAMM|nr:twin-arginine translocation pathway signal protein [Spartinivicinus marinus]MCX4027277.1 hypothetical protein [Spartinivicinus marinus]NYZ67963.1 twin-arginine translocation pathway signal protein [Spartinivicinus marinus]
MPADKYNESGVALSNKYFSSNKHFMLKRRQLLKVGAVGSLVLSGVIVVNQLADNRFSEKTTGYQFLNSADIVFLSAVTPVILGINTAELRADQVRQGLNWGLAQQKAFLKQLDEKLAYLSPALQLELRELLDLVGSPFSRWLITGIHSSWENTSTLAIENFLRRWQTSRIKLLRKAHHGLTQLCIMAWYSLSDSWPAIGYPGPPFQQTLITPSNQF